MRINPVLLVGALIGLGVGLWFGIGGSSTERAADADASAVESVDLDALQASLKNTLALPADFKRVPEFTLQGVDGEPLDEGFLDDRWTVAFFGYTHCPDVCPISLQVMKDVVATLEADGQDAMQVAFFTVDPNRDTAERMREYVNFFDEDFVGVTGELADVHALTRPLGIVSSFTANDDAPENYLVDHTASMLLIDPERRVRAKFNPPHEAATIVADWLALRDALG